MSEEKKRRSYDSAEIEMESFETHVVMCHARYDSMIEKIGTIEDKFDTLSSVIDARTETITKSVIGCAGTIIVGLVSLLVTLFLK